MQLQFGFICALLSFTKLSRAESSSDLLTCESDYWLRVNCFLDSRAVQNRLENITYQLEFVINKEKNRNCLLSVERDGYSCIFTAKLTYSSHFMSYNKINIYLCDPKPCQLLKSNFMPAQNIKPITPYNLTVLYVNSSYNFAWNSGYENHDYVKVLPFEYVLSYHPAGQSTVELHTKETVFRVSETVFDPGTEYVARVYNTVKNNTVYQGTASHLSAEIRWKTPAISATDGVTIVKKIVILVCLAVGLLSLLLFPVARMKIKQISWVETPSPYVSPINQTTQFWLSKGHMQYIYSEEISTIDVITENTARQQQQEHSSVVYSQSLTPYVSPLKEVWPLCLMPDSHVAANSAFTDPDFLPEDNDVEKFLLSLSAAEGCVSLDDLEPSLETSKSSEASSLPVSPVCFTQSYCTLTNTEFGLVPTFCRGQCAPSLDLGLKNTTSQLNIQIEESSPEEDTVTLDNLQLSMDE
ncbi:interleukin 21 receptor, tandem duplicate 2 isoform X2 [Tachysurus vachellii]|uniref:interleukin 21 receptor, tandem duplicate 2 isoform X2 n=1 Tax=Tachysurus vachellii TaxID=175792 RepID=UPI00296AE88E|nr:interleukin 21 receptor, tandem duplicate 2 isoform X2 [Tachysurus vachellii]